MAPRSTTARPTTVRRLTAGAVLVAALPALAAACGAPDDGTPDGPGHAPGAAAIDPGDWPHYARDLASSKYSPLDRIDASNVDRLEVAWAWESADYDLPDRFPGTTVNNNYQVTPIKVGNRLYAATNMGQAVALDPATGVELWRYDPYAAGLRDEPGGRANRGVAYWTDGADERILLGTGPWLVALDAATGRPVEGFGEGAPSTWPTTPTPGC